MLTKGSAYQNNSEKLNNAILHINYEYLPLKLANKHNKIAIEVGSIEITCYILAIKKILSRFFLEPVLSEETIQYSLGDNN